MRLENLVLYNSISFLRVHKDKMYSYLQIKRWVEALFVEAKYKQKLLTIVLADSVFKIHNARLNKLLLLKSSVIR